MHKLHGDEDVAIIAYPVLTLLTVIGNGQSNRYGLVVATVLVLRRV